MSGTRRNERYREININAHTCRVTVDGGYAYLSESFVMSVGGLGVAPSVTGTRPKPPIPSLVPSFYMIFEPHRPTPQVPSVPSPSY
jgi:hypothetical protein